MTQDSQTITADETIALLNQVLDETAKELGCENDNEAILQAIYDLKQRASLPSPPVSGERTPWLKHAQIRAVTEPRVDHTVHSVELVFETGEQSISAFMALNALKFGEAPLTNEPAGVTLSIEDVSRLHDLCLAITQFNEGDIFVTRPDFPELIARLSASITADTSTDEQAEMDSKAIRFFNGEQ